MAEKVFCKYHFQAISNLKERFSRWKNGYGDITWNTYLDRISKSPNTGILVKEVIELGLKEGFED